MSLYVSDTVWQMLDTPMAIILMQSPCAQEAWERLAQGGNKGGCLAVHFSGQQLHLQCGGGGGGTDTNAWQQLTSGGVFKLAERLIFLRHVA